MYSLVFSVCCCSLKSLFSKYCCAAAASVFSSISDVCSVPLYFRCNPTIFHAITHIVPKFTECFLYDV